MAACGGDSTGPRVPDVGLLRFQYSGDRSGVFMARGNPPENQSAPSTAFAAGVRDAGSVFITAFEPGAAPSGTVFALLLQGVTRPGVYDLDVLACDGGSSGCIFGVLDFDVDPTDITLSEDSLALDSVYFFVSGSVRVEQVSTEQIRGTFSGTAVRLDLDLISEDINAGGEITIRDGRFEVPLRAGTRRLSTMQTARVPELARLRAQRAANRKRSK